MNARRGHLQGFTLVELLVVTTLISIGVGMVVVRFDGLSAAGRLRSCAARYSAVLNLARTEARTSGQPRLLRTHGDQGKVTLHRPRRHHGTWQWDDGRAFQVTEGVTIRLLMESDESTLPQEGAIAVRIPPDGRCPPLALILKVQDRWAALRVVDAGIPQFLASDRPLLGLTFDQLMDLWESPHADPTGPDTD